MALADVLARAAQRNALIDGHIIADDGRFADDHAVAVVDEHPAADLRAGVNLNARLMPGPLAQNAGQQRMAFPIQDVGPAMGLQRFQPGIAQPHLQQRFGRRVPVQDRFFVFPDHFFPADHSSSCPSAVSAGASC